MTAPYDFCRPTDRRRGVPTYWFYQDVRFRNAQLSQLSPNRLGVQRAGHHQNAVGWNQRDHTPDGFLNQSTFREHFEKLLGIEFAAERPKSGAAPSSENNRKEVILHNHSPLSMRS